MSYEPRLFKSFVFISFLVAMIGNTLDKCNFKGFIWLTAPGHSLWWQGIHSLRSSWELVRLPAQPRNGEDTRLALKTVRNPEFLVQEMVLLTIKMGLSGNEEMAQYL